MGKVITITSGKGGVGKTTASANLAAALALAGKKTVAVDTDIGLRNLDVVMGLENRVIYDIVHVAEGKCQLEQALIRHKRVPGLYLLPASQSRDKSAVTVYAMKKLCRDLKSRFDFVIIDSPAGIEYGFQNSLVGADEVIVITTPEVSAVRDADRVIGLLEAAEKKSIGLIINRLKPAMVKRGDMMSTDDVTEILAIDLLGVIPDDEKIIVSTNRGELAVLDNGSRAGQAFADVARRMMGEEVPLNNVENGHGWLELVRSFFKTKNANHF